MRGRLATAARAGGGVAAIYAPLLAFEVVLWRRQPRSLLKLMERGLYVVEDGRVGLRPGARLQFDDGYARGEVVISSLGYRGHEPRGDPANRVLLVGDSYAFGSLLDQADTIDACMERLASGREVVNLGVTGYNLPEQLDPIRRWTLGARHVVYLFCDTDLDGAVDQLIVDGYRMRRLQHPDGTPYTDEEMRPATAQRIAAIERSRRLTSRSLLLPRVRRALRSAVAHAGPPPEAPADAGAVARGVDATEQMRALAEERGMTFQVAIVPSLREVTAGSYSPAVAAYASGLEAHGHEPIRLLDHLSVDLYWRHDGHLNPAGARVAARAINAALNGRP